jgi:hypothetical protein
MGWIEAGVTIAFRWTKLLEAAPFSFCGLMSAQLAPSLALVHISPAVSTLSTATAKKKLRR